MSYASQENSKKPDNWAAFVWIQKSAPRKICFFTNFIRTHLCASLDDGIGKCHQSQTWRYQGATVFMVYRLMHAFNPSLAEKNPNFQGRFVKLVSCCLTCPHEIVTRLTNRWRALINVAGCGYQSMHFALNAIHVAGFTDLASWVMMNGLFKNKIWKRWEEAKAKEPLYQSSKDP